MPKSCTCPFYITRSTREKKQATITCEKIKNNLGFDLRNQLAFNSHEEKEDYCGLFCTDMYEACPYYKAIYEETGGTD